MENIINDGGYIYPHDRPVLPSDDVPTGGFVSESGMTLRDHFAINATEADISNEMKKPEAEASKKGRMNYKPISRVEARYRFADAMITKRTL